MPRSRGPRGAAGRGRGGAASSPVRPLLAVAPEHCEQCCAARVRRECFKNDPSSVISAIVYYAVYTRNTHQNPQVSAACFQENSCHRGAQAFQAHGQAVLLRRGEREGRGLLGGGGVTAAISCGRNPPAAQLLGSTGAVSGPHHPGAPGIKCIQRTQPQSNGLAGWWCPDLGLLAALYSAARDPARLDHPQRPHQAQGGELC